MADETSEELRAAFDCLEEMLEKWERFRAMYEAATPEDRAKLDSAMEGNTSTIEFLGEIVSRIKGGSDQQVNVRLDRMQQYRRRQQLDDEPK